MPKRGKSARSTNRVQAASAAAPTRWPSRRRTAAILFLALSALYFCNFRMRGAGDSLPTRVLPFSILREGNLDLNEFTWTSSPERPWPYYIHGQEEPGGGWRFFSVSSIATSVVVTPLYVLPSLWLAWNEIPYVDSRACVIAVVMEKLGAALLAALSAAVLFLALSALTTPTWALALALVYALGTSTWSISSQALWAHGLSEVCLATLCFLLPRRERSWQWIVAIGVVCSVMVWNRPQMMPFAVMTSLFVITLDRRVAIPLAAAAVVAGGALVAYNLWALDSVFGGYGSLGHFSNPFLAGLAGLTISPNRGLFVFTPIVVFALWGIVEVWRGNDELRWLRYLTVALGAHVVMYAKFDEWWAGYTYGPRYFTDVLPLLIVLVAFGLTPIWRFGAIRAVAAVLAVWGVFVQAVGVYAADDGWNREPVSVDTQPQRVWDWNDMQIARSLDNGFRAFELLPVMVDAFSDAMPARLVELQQADLASRVEVTGMPERLRRGESAQVRVRLTNLGDAAWPSFSGQGLLDVRNLVFVVQTWQVGGRQIGGLGEVELLPENLAPGETIEMEMPIVAPEQAGRFDVEFRVTQAVDGQRGIPSLDASRSSIAVH